MKKTYSLGTLCTLAIILFSNHALAADFTPLGDLPGNLFDSKAFGVSADGAVIVGRFL
jgi:hypothetical protein